MTTVAELKKLLNQFPDDMEVVLYTPKEGYSKYELVVEKIYLGYFPYNPDRLEPLFREKFKGDDDSIPLTEYLFIDNYFNDCYEDDDG